VSVAKCSHELFVDQVLIQPNAPALLYKGEVVTYGQLNLCANRLARQLSQQGVGAEQVVGIVAHNVPETIVALLAVFKVGGAVLPLEPSYPIERIAFMIEDAEVALTLGHKEYSRLFDPARFMPVDHVLSSPSRDPNPSVCTTLDAAAYVLYTSGSTGKPKAVVRPHRSIVHRMTWMEVSPDDVLCHNMSLSVGFSQERLMLPLMYGLPLVIIPDEECRQAGRLLGIIKATKVTNLTVTPQILQQILDLGHDVLSELPHLRLVAVGGAATSAALAQAFGKVLPTVKLVNTYGSTESGTVIRGTINTELTLSQIPLGRPLPGVEIRILDAEMAECPLGVTGEMYITAPCLAREYLGDKGLTTARFLKDLVGKGSRTYRSGDIARLHPSGEIEWLGRADRQVKVRGYRVEPEEIESALKLHEKTRDALVIVETLKSPSRLIAYVVLKVGHTSTTSELRSFLAERLPDYMVPHLFAFLKEIPRTSAGKIDISALPPPSRERPRLSSAYEPPRTEFEQAIEKAWEDVIKIENIGIHDNFFELGGDSLLAIHLATHLQDTCGISLASSTIRDYPTIEGLCQQMTPLGRRECSESLGRMGPVPHKKDVALSFAQEYGLMAEFFAQARNERTNIGTAFAFSLEGNWVAELLESAITRIVQRHEILRTAFSYRVDVWKSVRCLMTRARNPLAVRFEARISDDAVVRMSTVNIESLSAERKREEIQRLVARVIGQPYDYTVPPLLRPLLIKTARDRYYLLLGVSHLIFDGWSSVIFQDELARIYASLVKRGDVPIAELPLQFADYAHWQRRHFSADVVTSIARSCAKQYLAAPPLRAVDLPFLLKSKSSGNIGETIQLSLDEALCANIKAFVARNAITFFELLFTATSVLLSMLTGRLHISLDTYFANREHHDTRKLIGDFANRHTISIDLTDDPALTMILKRVRHSLAESMVYQEVPVATLNQALVEDGQAPLASAEVSVEYMGSTNYDSAEPGLCIRRIPVPSSRLRVQTMPLIIRCCDLKDTLELQAMYRTNLFTSEAMQSLLKDLERVFKRILLCPSERRSQLEAAIVAAHARYHSPCNVV
jgi:amino acid adenylation domain-containing protein